MAQVHFDEDTPHLQVYFLPVVNEVKRKCYQRDKDGKDKEVPILLRDKNSVYKYLKAVMNFGTKWYDLNFVKAYNKMTNFTNPNERKKEISFYTPAEFQKFLSVENDVKFICAFQTLFYCGLRNGELRGLT